MLLESLLALALSWPHPWYPPGKNPETPEQYQERIGTIVQAVTMETQDRELATAVLVLTYQESRWRVDVHDGSKLGDHGRAACLGQIHVSWRVPKQDWEALTGTGLEATRRCVGTVAGLLGGYRRMCGSWEGAFSGYASGRGCTVLALGRERAARLAKVLTQ